MIKKETYDVDSKELVKRMKELVFIKKKPIKEKTDLINNTVTIEFNDEEES